MEAHMLVDAVTACVTSTLNSAQRAFVDRPSADNFTIATGAMLAYQQWKGLSAEKKIAASETLLPLGIGHWPDAIVKYATGKSIAEVLS